MSHGLLTGTAFDETSDSPPLRPLNALGRADQEAGESATGSVAGRRRGMTTLERS